MPRRPRLPVCSALCFVAAAFVWCGSARALEPDQIALVVNASVPAGRQLAEYYARERHIPDRRIIQLVLPAANANTPPEDCSPAEYDEHVVPVIKQFLLNNGLDKRVKCLVTFWGVPLRIGRRSVSPAEALELVDIKAQLEDLRGRLEVQLKSAEAMALELNKDFKPAVGPANDIDALTRRSELALNDIVQHVAATTDPKERRELFERLVALLRDLAGPATAAEKLAEPAFARLAPEPPSRAEQAKAHMRAGELQKQLLDLQAGPQTGESRQQMRDLFRAQLGTLNTARLLTTQERMLEVGESEAAFDSELSLLWFPPYPKARWEPNALNWRLAGKVRTSATPLMVMRLDAPSERLVHDMIETSIKVEQDGLTGQVVLDARGKPATEPYGQYDQTIRNLAEILRAKTKLTVMLDNQEALMGERSQKDIALYCGWYSLRHYVQPGTFNAGAVAFHVASSEMVSLHHPHETGWCVGLLNDGVAATLGPVAEPYLQSFPPADEFFPLLLTGKLTLAEVYCKTTPWVSWMQCCVGDPLYTPYKHNPPMKPADLPEPLRNALQ